MDRAHAAAHARLPAYAILIRTAGLVGDGEAMIRIDLKSDRITLGGRVAGQAIWNSDGGKQPRSIEVKWRRRFEGKKTTEHVLDSAEETNTESRSQIVVPFDFEVPMDEPPSYNGKLVSIV